MSRRTYPTQGYHCSRCDRSWREDPPDDGRFHRLVDAQWIVHGCSACAPPEPPPEPAPEPVAEPAPQTWLVNDHTGARLRLALDIEISAIRGTRFGAKIIDLRCGPLSCRIEVG